MYDLRMIDGKLSVLIEGLPPIHFMSCYEARIVIERCALEQKRRIAIENAITHLYAAHVNFCLGLRRRDNETSGDPDVDSGQHPYNDRGDHRSGETGYGTSGGGIADGERR